MSADTEDRQDLHWVARCGEMGNSLKIHKFSQMGMRTSLHRPYWVAKFLKVQEFTHQTHKPIPK